MTTFENATAIARDWLHERVSSSQQATSWRAVPQRTVKASRWWEAQDQLATGNQDGRRLIVCILVV